jgi:transposase-like protein
MGQNSTQVVKWYSLAFKKQVVQEYEAGASASALRRKYGIGCTHMIVKWVNKYGREGVRHKLMVVQSPEEQEAVKELEARVAELEKLVTQLSLDKFMLESSLAVAEEALGYKVKKKPHTPSSRKRKGGSKKGKVS